MTRVLPLLYADENVDGAIVRALHRLGWDVVRAIEQHAMGTSDDVHFASAAAFGRVMLTRDRDMLVIAAEWQTSGKSFAGVFFYHASQFGSTGQVVRAIDRSALQHQHRLADRVVYLQPTDR